MIIKRYEGNVELLRPIAEAWEKECNGNALGIDLDMDVHLRVLQKFVDDFNSDLFVLCDGDVPVGYMALQTRRSPVGKQYTAEETFWYVIPSKRGLSSLRFLKAAKQWARIRGCSHLTMSASTLASDLHDGVCKLYEHKGMKKFETTYIYFLGK